MWNLLVFPGSRAVKGVGLRVLACWDCGFESCWERACLSVVSAVFCQVEVSASGWSLVQRSPTGCGVPECDREFSTMRRSWPTRGCRTMERNWVFFVKLKTTHIFFKPVLDHRHHKTPSIGPYLEPVHIFPHVFLFVNAVRLGLDAASRDNLILTSRSVVLCLCSKNYLCSWRQQFLRNTGVL